MRHQQDPLTGIELRRDLAIPIREDPFDRVRQRLGARQQVRGDVGVAFVPCRRAIVPWLQRRWADAVAAAPGMDELLPEALGGRRLAQPLECPVVALVQSP